MSEIHTVKLPSNPRLEVAAKIFNFLRGVGVGIIGIAIFHAFLGDRSVNTNLISAIGGLVTAVVFGVLHHRAVVRNQAYSYAEIMRQQGL